ncbi:MAG: L,D-transpeptidase family protein [Enterococcus sp.]
MTRASRHKKTIKPIIYSVLGVAIVGLTGYAIKSAHYTNHFLPNTEINEIDISNLTIDEANEKLKGTADHQVFTITDNQDTWKEIKLTDLGLKTDFTTELEKIKNSQNQWSWGSAYVFASDHDDLDGLVLDEKTLNNEVNEVKDEVDQANDEKTKSKNASLVKGEDGYRITKEVNGTAIDADKFATALKEAVTEQKTSLELTTYTEKPAVTSTDKELNEELTQLNAIAQIDANYSINGDTFQIPTATINQWISYEDQEVTIDQEQVTAYVSDLGEQYNTSTHDTTFNSTKQGEVTVPTGTLSWTIQTDEEASALSEQILAGESFTRSPIVSGSTTADKPLVGDTYIEVDLTNQHMWYYEDGDLKLDTDIVSGKPASETPEGVDYVWKKEEDATLKGQNADGSDYASPVDYWMPIDWTGVGIHDSSWQSAYGGDRWKTNGSHGCVNTPPSVMKELYGMVEVGTPVLVFK